MPRLIVRVAFAALTCSMSLLLYAAEPGTSRPAALQEVVVTARKVEEPLQDVPASVSALTGATLEAMGADSFNDYARSIPGLYFQDSGVGRQTITIRGIGNLGGLGTVGYYIGETPMPESYGVNNVLVDPRLIDVDRIEVLRGPQGTLYGSGSIGGTIRLLPNAPNLSRFEGSVKGEALVTQGADGASPGGRTALVLNVPIAQDLVAVRGAFWYDNVGGYINRTYGYVGGVADAPQGKVGNIPDEHTWGMRATLLYQPVEQFSVSAMAYLQRQHFDGFQDITGSATNPPSNPPLDQLVQEHIFDIAEPQDNTFNLYSLTAKYSFSRFNVVSVTSYSDQRQTLVYDYTPFGQSIFDLALPTTAGVQYSTYNFTEEARLATSERIAGFDAVTGVFYSKIHTPQEIYISPRDYNAMVAGNDPNNPLYAPDGNFYTSWGEALHVRQTAVFGNLTYHFTDRFSLTGGVRHYDISTSTDTFANGWLIGGNVPGVTSESTASSSSNGFVYTGDISYKLTPDDLLYGRYAEGFRPGVGNTLLPGCPAELNQSRPDSIKSYEVGVKTSWMERRLTFNGAAYRMNWQDIQQVAEVFCTGGLAAFPLVNSGDAVVKGGELEANVQLTPRLTTGVSATYLHSELLQDSPVAGGGLAGDPILAVPNWNYALYAQTSFPVLLSDDGFARVDYQYTGSSYGGYTRLADGSRDPASKLQVVRLLNLRTGIHYHAWEFALSGTNLLNNIFISTVNAFGSVAPAGLNRYTINRPRTFSVSATYQF
jgi:iron complex outermembrane receptor protein